MKKTILIFAGFIALIWGWYFLENVTISLPSRSERILGENIVIESPSVNEEVGNPIIVSGRARVFENTFQYRLLDNQGNILYDNFSMTDASDIGIFGDFTVRIPVPVGASNELWVEVYELSAKDGSMFSSHAVPVILKAEGANSVKIFFSNSNLGDSMDCSQVFPVNREIVPSIEVAYSAINELIKGPTLKELEDGYITNLPINDEYPIIRINSLNIDNETAYVDFDAGLEMGVAGSCRVEGIRSQIENTLKQFPSIKEVVISINGRTEDILQP